MKNKPWIPATIALVGAAFIAVVVWLVLFGAQQLVPRDITAPVAIAQSGVRAAAVALAGGSLAVAGLFYTDRALRHARAKDREQAELTRQAQVIDRYAAAIGHLASEKPIEQLGGIYGLEAISRESENEHITVVKILAGFIRERAPRSSSNSSISESSDPALRPPGPVQAALATFGRWPDGRNQTKVDLSGTDLRGAQLSLINLPYANLRHADLRGADLGSANIHTTDFSYSDLREADFAAAHLQAARFGHTNLAGTYLTYADIQGVALSDADLSDTLGLTAQQVISARPTLSTKLPTRIAEDPRVRTRIADIEAENDAYEAEHDSIIAGTAHNE